MPTLYKTALMKRLREKVREGEGKGLIPLNQAGFRKGMETLDNIYRVRHQNLDKFQFIRCTKKF